MNQPGLRPNDAPSVRVPMGQARRFLVVAMLQIERAFASGEGAGLVHLATLDFKAALRPSVVFARSFSNAATVCASLLDRLGFGETRSHGGGRRKRVARGTAA